MCVYVCESAFPLIRDAVEGDDGLALTYEAGKEEVTLPGGEDFDLVSIPVQAWIELFLRP